MYSDPLILCLLAAPTLEFSKAEFHRCATQECQPHKCLGSESVQWSRTLWCTDFPSCFALLRWLAPLLAAAKSVPIGRPSPNVTAPHLDWNLCACVLVCVRWVNGYPLSGWLCSEPCTLALFVPRTLHTLHKHTHMHTQRHLNRNQAFLQCTCQEKRKRKRNIQTEQYHS